MLGSGHPTLVPHWTRSFPMPTRLTSHSVLNPAGRKAWREDGPTEGKCLWEMHAVWGWDLKKDEGVVLRENYFVKDPMTGRKVMTLLFFSLNVTFLTVVRPSRRLTGTQTFITLSSKNGESEYERSPLPISWSSWRLYPTRLVI
jgi:hypothetical protein